ncbi:clathrin light chain B-like isoform X1 [Lampetra fluviatilis]
MSDAFDAAFGSDATAAAASFPEGGESSTSPTAVLSGGGGGGGDEDPAAAFLAQQESEMAGIEGMAEGTDGGGGAAAMMMMGGGVMEGDVGGMGMGGLMDGEGFGILDSGEVPHSIGGDDFDLGLSGDLNGDIYKDANGPPTAAGGGRGADLPPAPEPESLRRWRHEQRERLDQLDAASRKAECEWRERAKKELEEWRGRQGEQLEKTRRNNRVADEAFFEQPNAHVIGYMAAEEACVREREEEEGPGSEWERVARLCDFNPKTSKQTKDVSRMRSIIISLKQSPLVR